MPQPTPDTSLVAIVERIRFVIERQSDDALDAVANSLLLDRSALRPLIAEGPTDRELVLDLVSALVYCQGMDPRWLLSGKYDAAVHRHALLLGEERGSRGMIRMREFVREQFERLRRNTPPFLEFPGLNPF